MIRSVHLYRSHFEGWSTTLSKSGSGSPGKQIFENGDENIPNWSSRLHDSRTQTAKSNCNVVFVQRQFGRSVNAHFAGNTTSAAHTCYEIVNKKCRGTWPVTTYSARGNLRKQLGEINLCQRRAGEESYSRKYSKDTHCACMLSIQDCGTRVFI